MNPTVKARLLRGFTRVTGLELRRARPSIPATPALPKPVIEVAPPPPDPQELAERMGRVRPGDRLLTAPVFILCSVRSGSTLLRLILDTHSQICAPHELHLRRITAKITARFGRIAMDHLGLDELDLRSLLWDRLLHWELQRSGKSVFVNKTPNDALIWADIVSCWPDARFIYLQRNPASILASWDAAMSDLTRDEAAQDILAYGLAMEQARAARGGLVVRYEDLVSDPTRETQRICEFVGVPWEESMLNYGSAEHSGMRRGLGDWSAKIKTGTIQASVRTSNQADLPDILRPVAEAWGYLPAANGARAVEEPSRDGLAAAAPRDSEPTSR